MNRRKAPQAPVRIAERPTASRGLRAFSNKRLTSAICGGSGRGGRNNSGMVIDPDHLSVLARQQLLDVVERRGYSGIVSSHSWSTPDAIPRILRLGGVVTPMAGSTTDFAAAWKDTKAQRDPRFYYEPAVEAIAESGIAVEVSTAGLRKHVGEIYPAPAFAEMCVEAGAEFALSSDAHAPDQVGYGYDSAIEFLEGLGVDRICVFDRRERRLEPLGDPEARVEGERDAEGRS